MNKLHYVLFSIALLFFSCSNNKVTIEDHSDDCIVEETIEYLNSFTYLGDLRDDVDGGIHSWESFGSTWKKDTIRYYIDYIPLSTNKGIIEDYFNGADKSYIKALTFTAASEWMVHIKKVVYEVNDPSQADFYILWKPLENDGKGKRLAVSDGPLDDDMENKPIMIMDLVDMYQIVKDREDTKYRYYNVILHELGHMLAGLAHDNSVGVMNSAFNFNELQLDDIAGARLIYKNRENFVYKDREYIYISIKNGNKNISPNFKVNELISKCGGYDGEHFIAKDLIHAIQYIRDTYNCPIRITSSYRNTKCNHGAGGAKMSQHLFMSALDWKFTGPKAAAAQRKYFNDIISKKHPLERLLDFNIRGFGSYTYDIMLNHIDVRNENIWNAAYKGRGYMIWGRYKGAFEIGDEFRRFD